MRRTPGSHASPVSAQAARPLRSHAEGGGVRRVLRAPRGGGHAARPTAEARPSPACTGDLADRALGDDPPLGEHRGGVTGPLDLIQPAGGQDHGPALVGEAAQQLAELEYPGRVQPVRRLVQDQQLGVAEQAGRHAEALAQGRRVGGDPVTGPLAQAHPLQRRLDPAVGSRLPGRGEDPEVFPPGEVAVEARLPDQGAHLPEGQAPLRRDGDPEHAHGSGAGRGQAEHHADQDGLAGTLRSGEAERAAPGNGEGHVVDHRPAAEFLGQPGHLQGRGVIHAVILRRSGRWEHDHQPARNRRSRRHPGARIPASP